jgi:hypothetical protein
MLSLSLALIAFWPFGGNTITKADLEKSGGNWPLTVDRITFTCTKAGSQRMAIFELPSPIKGVKYFRLVGAATTEESIQLQSNMPIWRQNSTIPGARVSIADLQQEGIRRCK